MLNPIEGYRFRYLSLSSDFSHESRLTIMFRGVDLAQKCDFALGVREGRQLTKADLRRNWELARNRSRSIKFCSWKCNSGSFHVVNRLTGIVKAAFAAFAKGFELFAGTFRGNKQGCSCLQIAIVIEWLANGFNEVSLEAGIDWLLQGCSLFVSDEEVYFGSF